jgi:hypothetical protein
MTIVKTVERQKNHFGQVCQVFLATTYQNWEKVLVVNRVVIFSI